MNNPGILENVLGDAVAALLAIDAGKVSLDDVLDQADPGYRRSFEHLLLNIFRFRKSVSDHWRQFCTRGPVPEIAALLDAALSQCLFQNSVASQSVVNVAVSMAKKKHADKFVNAVLRKSLREKWSVPDAPEKLLPAAVLKRWRKMFAPETVAELAGLFISEAPFTFRLCKDAELPANASAAAGFGGFRFAAANGRDILTSAEFAAGQYYIQDPAASLAVSLAVDELPEHPNVLDLCAAPGGKALMLAERIPENGTLTAADRSARRQELTRENFRKRHLPARIITARPEDITGKYDLVLADVPCSNSGVFRRRPDALWRFSEKSLQEIMALQNQIIVRAAGLVVPGGVLICSSCSIDTDENDSLVDSVLKNHPDFECVSKHTLLPAADHDGAFAAKLVRKRSAHS